MILIVTEGRREEKLLSEALERWGFFGDDVKVVVYGTNIHLLVDALRKYEHCAPEDVDITMLLREISRRNQSDQHPNIDILNEKYSDILFFFDMEPQHTQANWNDVRTLLKQFSADTTTGKLFINFPMFESLFLEKQKFVSFESLLDRGSFKKFAHNSDLWRKFSRSLINGKAHRDPKKNLSKDDILHIIEFHKLAYKEIVGSEYEKAGIPELLEAELKILSENNQIFCINSSILSVLDFGVCKC